MTIFKGCATALITPFNKNGIDFDAFGNLIEFQIENDIDALVVCGTTGEPATMTKEEKLAVIDFAIKKTQKRKPLIVGTGGNNTAEAVAFSKEVENLGADALLVVTPYYNKCTQNGLIAYYKAIAESVSLPIICYNVPGRTGVNILPSTFAEIAKIENIAAIKEASGNMEQICETARLSQGLATVYSGDDAITVPVLSIGGSGVISVASNIVPKYMHNMVENFMSGNTVEAGRMQLNINPLVKALFSEVNPIPVKCAASLMGLCENIVRSPLTVMEEATTAKLAYIMQNLDLI